MPLLYHTPETLLWDCSASHVCTFVCVYSICNMYVRICILFVCMLTKSVCSSTATKKIKYYNNTPTQNCAFCKIFAKYGGQMANSRLCQTGAKLRAARQQIPMSPIWSSTHIASGLHPVSISSRIHKPRMRLIPTM